MDTSIDEIKPNSILNDYKVWCVTDACIVDYGSMFLACYDAGFSISPVKRIYTAKYAMK
jgi:hypothetical protein